MKEATFIVPHDIPTTPKTKYYFRAYLTNLFEQVGKFGDEGQAVGIGFVWETRTGLSEGGLNTLSRRMQRALKTSGILSRRAEPYFLKQKINYIRDGEATAIFTIKED